VSYIIWKTLSINEIEFWLLVFCFALQIENYFLNRCWISCNLSGRWPLSSFRLQIQAAAKTFHVNNRWPKIIRSEIYGAGKYFKILLLLCKPSGCNTKLEKCEVTLFPNFHEDRNFVSKRKSLFFILTYQRVNKAKVREIVLIRRVNIYFIN